MSRTERTIAEVKHVEDELRGIGENIHADRVARLRRGYAQAISTLKTLHKDNMELRKRLGLPSFLDDK